MKTSKKTKKDTPSHAKSSSGKKTTTKKVSKPSKIKVKAKANAKRPGNKKKELDRRVTKKNPSKSKLTSKASLRASTALQATTPEIQAESETKGSRNLDSDRKSSGQDSPIPSTQEAVPPTPIRPPTRKIVGPGKTLITLEERAKTTELPNPDVSNLPGNQAVSVATVINEPITTSHITSIPLPKLSEIFTKPSPVSQALPLVAPATSKSDRYKWSELPQVVSKDLRAQIGDIEQSCSTASGSPFPFAKYISSLPLSVCGREFATVVAALDSDPHEIAPLLNLQVSEAEELLNEACSNIVDLFASLCPGMYRTWKAQIAARSLSVKSLVEHHLISGVAPEFQEFIAAITLRAMGVERPWSMGSRG